MVNQIDPAVLQSILIVDDDPTTIQALETILLAEGFQVLKAENGKEAIEIIQHQSLGLIICDLRLPDISGIDVLKKAMECQPDTSRIILTGYADIQDAASLVNCAEISQFIIKPWDCHVLMHAVNASIEKRKLQMENERLSQLTAEQNEELKHNHDKMKQELIFGGKIQSLLLEGKPPSDIKGLDIEAVTIPSDVIDGDFYDFYLPSDHIVDIVFGDVMGKGLAAALVGTAVKTQLARFALPRDHRLLYDKTAGWRFDLLNPVEIITQVNKELYSPLNELDHFVSLFYGRFDLIERTFSYVDCGSTKPIRYDAKRKKTMYLSGENFPLGISNESYTQIESQFGDDDLFVFYSDGVTEATSPDGELFGTKRIAKIVERYNEESPSEIIERIKEAHNDFTKTEQLKDDTTLIIFKAFPTIHHTRKNRPNIAKFNSDTTQLKAVRNFIRNFCLQLPEQNLPLTELMELSVDEIFYNVIKHGYNHESGNEIIIQADIIENTILIEILDQGKSFDPSKIQSPSFFGDKDEGFGHYLIREICDNVTYTPKKTEKGWNCLRITKKINYKEGKMDISHYTQDNILIVTLESENLDAKEAPDFKRKVTDLYTQMGIHNLILDLSNLNFIDSTGLGCFLSLLRSLNGLDGDLKLASLSRPVRTIFELVSMHKIFEIYTSIDYAIAAYQEEKEPKKEGSNTNPYGHIDPKKARQ